jgi:tetratricopeptide (TPR) repeat protein
LAISYALANRRKEALDTLERVRAQNPKVGCEGDDGIALDFLGDHAGADKAFESAIASEPSLAEPYERRGEVRMRRKDWAGAASDFEKAHQRAPHWADPLKNWGDCFGQQGQVEAALEKYEAAQAYAPDWSELAEAIRLARLRTQHQK